MTDTNLSPRTGYDLQTAFDVRLDTAKTMDSVLNMPSRGLGITPVDFNQGQNSSTQQQSTSIQDTPANIGFEDALNSDDPKLRNIAIQTLARNTAKNPYVKLGLGNSISGPVTPESNKFINKQYGYDIRNNNEDFYYKNEYMNSPWYVRWPLNVLKFSPTVAVGAATKFAEGIGYLGSMAFNGVEEGIKALAGKETSFWSDVADNSFAKVMKDADQSFRDHIMPVYKQAGFDDQGFFSKLDDAAFWNDSVADGVAFMASAFIPAGIASKAGWLAKGTGLFGAASKLSRGANIAIKALTGAETFGEAGLAAFNVANEAAFEATQTFTDNKDQLTAARSRGENNLTDSEINNQSGSKASKTFGWNVAALTLSNAWEMKNIIKPLIGRGSNPLATASNVVVNEAGEAGFKEFKNKFLNKIASTRIGKALPFYGKKAIEATMMEGFWEENIQSAIQRASAGGYTRTGDDTKGSWESTDNGFFGIIKQYAKQTVDALKGNDREVAESIGVGGLIGIIGGAGGAKFGMREDPRTREDGIPGTGKKRFMLGERRANEFETNAKIAEINNAWNDRMSLKGVIKPDGTVDNEKLAAKVASFQSLSRKQEVLDAIKEQNTLAPEEIKALENKLLNDYVKGIAKVGKVNEAVDRLNKLAARPLDQNAEKLISDPTETASYVREVGELYNEIQKRNIQAKTDPKYTPQQMEQLIEARKDRAFDLIAERKAIEPILNARRDEVDSAHNAVLNVLNAAGTTGTDIDQMLQKHQATDYIKAATKREFYKRVLKSKAPDFIKEHVKNKIKEADDEINRLNDFLGDENKLEVKDDGQVIFPTSLRQLTPLLEIYKSNYEEEADLEFDQQSNEAVADALLNPIKGNDNWKQYVDFIRDIVETSELETPPAPITNPAPAPSPVTTDTNTTNPTGTTTDIPPTETGVDTTTTGNDTTTEDDGTSDTDTDQDDVDTDVDEDPEKDTADTTEDVDADEGDDNDSDTQVEEVIANQDSIGTGKAITWYTPLITSKNDTDPTDEDTETLRDIPYDQVRQRVIEQIISQPDFDKNFKLFIVKDTFTEIYRPPAHNENDPDFIPTGEVIVLERLDGTRPTVEQLLPGWNAKGMENMPIVFSFNRNMFFQSGLETRASIRAKKLDTTEQEAKDFYNTEHEQSLRARELVTTDPTRKVEIAPIDSSNGVVPTTSNTSVIDRFGDDFEIVVQTTDINNSKKGRVIAKFKSASFPVGVQKVESDAGILSNLQKILDKTFPTAERAKQVRSQYLNSLFHTNEDVFFSIVEDHNTKTAKIVFKRVRDEDKGLDRKAKRKAAVPSNEQIHQLKFNVNRKALQNGMNVYNPDTDSFDEAMDAEDYTNFIKKKLTTSRKRILDRQGKLKMGSVNPHFAFRIIDPSVRTADQQKKDLEQIAKDNHSKIINRITQLFDSKQLTEQKATEIRDALPKMLNDKKLTQKNVDDILKFLDANLKVLAKSKPVEQPIITNALGNKELRDKLDVTIFNLRKERDEAKGQMDQLETIPQEELSEKDVADLTVVYKKEEAKYIAARDEVSTLEYALKYVEEFPGNANLLDIAGLPGFSRATLEKYGFIKEGEVTKKQSSPQVTITNGKVETATPVQESKPLTHKQETKEKNIVKTNEDIAIENVAKSLVDKYTTLEQAIGQVKQSLKYRGGDQTPNELRKIAMYDAELDKLKGITPKTNTEQDIERRRKEELDNEDARYRDVSSKAMQLTKTDGGKKLGDEITNNLEIIKSINAKYDAELAALKGTKVESKKAETNIPEEFERKIGNFKVVQRTSENRNGEHDATFQEITNLTNGYGIQKRISKDGKITYGRFASGNRITFEGGTKEEKFAFKENKEEFYRLSDKQKTSDEEYIRVVLGEQGFNQFPLFNNMLPSSEINENTPKVMISQPVVTTPVTKPTSTRGSRKGQEKISVSEAIGNVVATEKPTEYLVTVADKPYRFDPATGFIKFRMRLGQSQTFKEIIVNKAEDVYGKVLNELSKAYPFTKYDDGTVSGIYRAELEGTDGNITAFGLPIAIQSDVYVTSDGKGIKSVNSEGAEISAVDFVSTLLTENGNKQLKEFLNRNC